MPILPLPPLDEESPIGGGDLPVASVDDVKAVWSPDLAQSQSAPLRDAIQQAETEMLLAYQASSSYAAAQSDRLRATGEYLDECGDEREVHRQKNEEDSDYRPRINETPTVCDPNDIIAAANRILAPFTSISARYCEQSDGLFLGSVDATWSSHLFATEGPNWPPNFPDRLYPECTPAGLQPIPNRRPGGAILFNDPFGHIFILRVPDITGIDTHVTALFDGSIPTTDADDGVFLGDGTTAGAFATYLWSIEATSYDVYNAIINAVERIRGHGIRWILLVDPKLTA